MFYIAFLVNLAAYYYRHYHTFREGAYSYERYQELKLWSSPKGRQERTSTYLNYAGLLGMLTTWKELKICICIFGYNLLAVVLFFHLPVPEHKQREGDWQGDDFVLYGMVLVCFVTAFQQMYLFRFTSSKMIISNIKYIGTIIIAAIVTLFLGIILFSIAPNLKCYAATFIMFVFMALIIALCIYWERHKKWELEEQNRFYLLVMVYILEAMFLVLYSILFNFCESLKSSYAKISISSVILVTRSILCDITYSCVYYAFEKLDYVIIATIASCETFANYYAVFMCHKQHNTLQTLGFLGTDILLQIVYNTIIFKKKEKLQQIARILKTHEIYRISNAGVTILDFADSILKNMGPSRIIKARKFSSFACNPVLVYPEMKKNVAGVPAEGSITASRNTFKPKRASTSERLMDHLKKTDDVGNHHTVPDIVEKSMSDKNLDKGERLSMIQVSADVMCSELMSLENDYINHVFQLLHFVEYVGIYIFCRMGAVFVRTMSLIVQLLIKNVQNNPIINEMRDYKSENAQSIYLNVFLYFTVQIALYFCSIAYISLILRHPIKTQIFLNLQFTWKFFAACLLTSSFLTAAISNDTNAKS